MTGSGASEEDPRRGDLLAAEALELLRRQGLTLGLAESLTGGFLGATLTAVPGSSAVLRGGLVAYATDVKAALLGVDAALLAREGPVHGEVARQMAQGAAALLGADVGLATTGVAGPGPQDGVPAGTVFVAVAWPAGARVARLALPGDREGIRRRSVRAALGLLVDGPGAVPGRAWPPTGNVDSRMDPEEQPRGGSAR